MSLEALLKDAEAASAWEVQRRKLLRLGTGLLVSLVGLTTALLLILPKHKASANVIQARAADTEAQAKSLAQLMRVKKEAQELKADIAQRRAPTAIPAGAVSASYGRHRGSEQVINYEPGDGFTNLVKTHETVYIPTGAVFQAQLLTPIKTSVERTFVMAEVTHEFRMDMKRKILAGSRLIGRSRLNPVLKGVIVEFETLVTPAGIETPISGLALSRNALPEIEGLFFSNKLVNYGTALAFGFLSGFADAARTVDLTPLGAVPTISAHNQVLTGFSTAAFQVGDEMLRDIQTHSVEYVVVPAGEQVFVALTRRYDMVEGSQKQ